MALKTWSLSLSRLAQDLPRTARWDEVWSQSLLKMRAHTRSEARALLKKMLNLPRLPAGVTPQRME